MPVDSAGSRFRAIEFIVDHLLQMPAESAVVLLEQFQLQCSLYNATNEPRWAYSQALTDCPSASLAEIEALLREKDAPPPRKSDHVWSSSSVRLFISHNTADKATVAAVKDALTARGFACFVAHQDIAPTREWADEILLALDTCDAVLAWLSEDFHASPWTDQEVGYAIARRIPIVPVKLLPKLDPYGLMGRYQALTVPPDSPPVQAAGRVADAVSGNPLLQQKLLEVAVAAFERSGTYAEAKERFKTLEHLKGPWTAGHLRRVEAAAVDNSQIRDAFGVPDRVRALVAREQT